MKSNQNYPAKIAQILKTEKVLFFNVNHVDIIKSIPFLNFYKKTIHNPLLSDLNVPKINLALDIVEYKSIGKEINMNEIIKMLVEHIESNNFKMLEHYSYSDNQYITNPNHLIETILNISNTLLKLSEIIVPNLILMNSNTEKNLKSILKSITSHAIFIDDTIGDGYIYLLPHDEKNYEYNNFVIVKKDDEYHIAMNPLAVIGIISIGQNKNENN